MTDDDTTDDTTDEQTESLREELNAVLPGNNPLENIRINQTGPAHYTVLSGRNGAPTAHRVNIQDVTCTCSDMTFNKNLEENSDGGREICAHLAAVLVEHPQLETEGQLAYQHMGLMDRTERALHKLETEHNDLRDLIENTAEAQKTAEKALAKATDSGSDGNDANSSDGSETTGNDETPPPIGSAEAEGNAADPQEAADRLQSAFDNVIADMQVKAANGKVWVQTGQNTPDTLDAPGNPSVFDTFLSGPEQVQYIHENHDLYGQKPGEWWKNMIEPEDVDGYISEVLE